MWNIIQCAVQGKGHIKDNIPCQDKTYGCKKNDTVVTALADGAGSAKLSHFGAEDITQYMCFDFAENFDMYFNTDDGAAVKKELIDKIISRLESLSSEMKCSIEDLASTLLVAAVKDNRYILIHIGDGVIGYLKNDELKVASTPENGEFANTTVFTTSKDALLTMKIMKGQLNGINGFVSISDGTETSLYSKRDNKLAEIIKKVMQMTAYIQSETVERQLTDSFLSLIRQSTSDDCSIAFMFNDNDSFPGYRCLSFDKKAELLQLEYEKNNPRFEKRLRRYSDIIICLESPRSLTDISRHIHLKPKYTKKHITRLMKLNLVEKKGNLYKASVIL